MGRERECAERQFVDLQRFDFKPIFFFKALKLGNQRDCTVLQYGGYTIIRF